MYKRLYTILNNNIIYNLQFGFRQHYSTSHALINISESMRKAFDEGNLGCGVFINLQKAFDTVDQQILLAKLDNFWIGGVSNNWFKSYLPNRNQFVSINCYDSGLTAINCGVLEGSINDTNFLCLSNSIKKLNKLLNADVKHLVNWLNANKISLIVKKTEMVVFKSK